MAKYLDEKQLARRVERRVANSQRKVRVMNYILCAVVLVLGIAVLFSIISHWFTL